MTLDIILLMYGMVTDKDFYANTINLKDYVN